MTEKEFLDLLEFVLEEPYSLMEANSDRFCSHFNLARAVNDARALLREYMATKTT